MIYNDVKMITKKWNVLKNDIGIFDTVIVTCKSKNIPTYVRGNVLTRRFTCDFNKLFKVIPSIYPF